MVKNRSFLKSVIPVILFLFFISCENDKKAEKKELEKEQKLEPKIRFGFNLDKYSVVNDTVSKGDTFGGMYFFQLLPPVDLVSVFFPLSKKYSAALKCALTHEILIT